MSSASRSHASRFAARATRFARALEHGNEQWKGSNPMKTTSTDRALIAMLTENTYGARMGRASGDTTSEAPCKVTLQRVRLNSGGYDSGGAYWGLDAPLYWACIEFPQEPGRQSIDLWFRAASRGDAKAEVREQFPNARFYN